MKQLQLPSQNRVTPHIRFYPVRIPLASLLLLSILLSSCGANDKKREEQELKRTVARYNNSVVEAYKNKFFKPLQGVASTKEVERVDLVVNYKFAKNQIMESEPYMMAFTSIEVTFDEEFDETTAIVKTTEDWTYRWVDRETGVVIEPMREFHYEVIYDLLLTDEGWLVQMVDTLGGKRRDFVVWGDDESIPEGFGIQSFN